MKLKYSMIALALLGACSATAQKPEGVPLLTLAMSYKTGTELSLYWVSEKLDGIRALWDGSQLVTRNGNIIHAPAWFTKDLPAFRLEGELWAGRGNFHLVQQTVLDKIPSDAAWKKIRLMLFDLPDNAGNYAKRYHDLGYWLAGNETEHLGRIAQSPIHDETDLNRLLDTVTGQKGEGLMLRRVDMPYQGGRSEALLKVKKHEDAEARVIGYNIGEGKYEGMVGSLIVETSEGVRFKVGSGLSDALRREPPEIGSVITYRYNGYTINGIPRFARFVRMRAEE